MSDIDEIKSRLNIVDIIGSRLPLKKAGRNFKALCPFHHEKTPSFIVSAERQIYHCFGCSAGGGIFDFVMAFDHLDFPEALEDLAQLAGVKLERRSYAAPQDQLKQKLYEVNHLASEFYHYLLTKHRLGEKARDYLKHRGVSDKSIATFVLGYSPNSWDGLLKFLHKKGYEEELMEKAGLVVASTHQRITASRNYYDRFRGRVMFTLKDHRGNVVGFAGRVLDPEIKDLPAGRQEAKYINTSETPVYVKSKVLYGLDVTKSNIQKAGEAVVMEGELDVISSYQAGVANAVAIKGSALTEEHARLLKRFAERLTFALDSDLAGDAAARRGIEIADSLGFDMKVVTLTSGKDPDEVARESPGLLKEAIQKAVPVYDYFLTSALQRFDVTTAYGKKKIGEELLPMLAKIENPIVQNHYSQKIARALEVSEETINQGIRQVKTSVRKETGVKTEASAPTTLQRGEKLEVYLLALILQGKTRDWLGELGEQVNLQDLLKPPVAQILQKLVKFLETHRTFLLKDFVDSLPQELIPTLDEAYLWDVADFIEDDIRSYREWDKALRELRRSMLHHKIKALTGTGEQTKLRGLTNQLKELEKSG